MNFPWVISLAREDAASVAALRLLAGLEVAESETDLWLRGPRSEDSLDLKLAALPARGRFELIGSNQLRPVHQRVPSGKLPVLSWQPLNAWLQVALPSAALPGDPPVGILLQLVRSTAGHEPEILLTTLEEFRRFAMKAAQIRLNHLQFAADDQGGVIVRGRPLPPLPGKRFVPHGGVAVAAGFHWTPAVSKDVLARCFGVAGEALVLWQEDKTITRLHAEQFVAVSRSAVCATAESLANNR